MVSVLNYGEFEVFEWDIPGGPLFDLQRNGEPRENCGAIQMVDFCLNEGIPLEALRGSRLYVRAIADRLLGQERLRQA